MSKLSNNVAQHDKPPAKSALFSREMSSISGRSDIML